MAEFGTSTAITKGEALVQFPSRLKKLSDLLSTPGPHLADDALEHAAEGVFESEDVETQVVWCRFPRIIVDMMGEVARNPDRPFNNKIVAVIRAAVYAYLLEIAKEDTGDVPAAALQQYLRSQRLLARKAFEAGSERTHEAALHAIEVLLGRAVDNDIAEDVHKELLDLDEVLKGSTHRTWKVEFKKRIRDSGMVAKAVSYLAQRWQDGTPVEQERADAWVSWWENL